MFDQNWDPWNKARHFFEHLFQTSTDKLRNSQNREVHQIAKFIEKHR